MAVKVSIKEIGSCEKVLTIEVPSDEIKREYEAFYAGIEKVAKIPGFRPGKAPRHILAIHFKDSAREEVLKKLIPKSLHEAFVSKGISPIGNPMIERLDFNSEQLTYDAYVELRPKIKLDRYKSVEVKSKPIVIEDSEVKDILKRMQESHAKFVPVENREAVLGDFLVCDYVCLVDGKEIEKRTEDLFSLKEKDYLEGFSNQLLGVKAGDQRDVKVKFPENYVNKKYAGKEGIFQVSVKEIKIRELPPITDELAKESGDFETVQDLEKKIREELEARKKEEQKIEIENALLEELLKRSRFDIPKRMVERRLVALLEETLHRLRHQGLKEEAEAKQKDALREKLRPEAERQIRISFVLDEIASKEKIEATEADFQLKYELFVRQYRKPLEEIKTYFEKTDGRKDSLELQIVNEKAIQFVKDHAVIKTS